MLIEPLEVLLQGAVKGVRPAPTEEPWPYGWASADYRRSRRASLPSPDGPVALTSDAIDALELVVPRLARESAVRLRWDPNELGGVVASLIARASASTNADTAISQGLSRIRGAAPTLIVLPMANVEWSAAPTVIADCIIGEMSDEWVATVNAESRGRHQLAEGDLKGSTPTGGANLKDDPAAPHARMIMFACWTAGQGQLANDQANRRLQDLVDLSLLLCEDPSSVGLYSGRGSTNRPGVRGVTLDRRAISTRLSTDDSGRSELAARVLSVSDFGSGAFYQWYRADPVPLHALTASLQAAQALNEYLPSHAAIPRRLKVAARWYAAAHWAENSTDAILALGIALDAMLGEPGGLPGRIMAQRFALLEPQSDSRSACSNRFTEIFSARSSIAHGGETSRIHEAGFVRSVEADVRWTAERMIALDRAFGPPGDSDFRKVFDGLTWGTLQCPPMGA